jgi:hypothetical protein
MTRRSMPRGALAGAAVTYALLGALGGVLLLRGSGVQALADGLVFAAVFVLMLAATLGRMLHR